MPSVFTFPRDAGEAQRPTVIAIHCSAASPSEWRQLMGDLGQRFSTVAPDLIGPAGISLWVSTDEFRLVDEAAQIVRMIDHAARPVHLVGHSYGGCVALRAAIERPAKIASIALYEPACFHLLKTTGDDGKIAFAEVEVVAAYIERLLLSGDHHGAAKRFFEYWNGDGTWAAARPETRDEVVRYIPKFPFEFAAAADDRFPLHGYRRLNAPVLLLRGEHAPSPTAIIVRQLARAMRFSSLRTIFGAGHMGPLSHASAVSAMIADWIVGWEPELREETRTATKFNRAI